MQLKIFDVEHGACAMIQPPGAGALAMIDCGDNTTTSWRPSDYIRNHLVRTRIDYLFITNADQDHISDLDGLITSGIDIGVIIRNGTPDAAVLRLIKQAGGPLTNDMERYLALHQGYAAFPAVPFDAGMNGVTCATFCNLFPDFVDTNNLSMAVFVRYAGFKILFPGDLEEDGWHMLLQLPAFVTELAGTDILVASHHGRENGICTEIFDYFRPQAVVFSDDDIQYDTQATVATYSYYVRGDGVVVENEAIRRKVLTTRSDGNILFRVEPNGRFFIDIRHG